MWKSNPFKEKKNAVILLLGVLYLIRASHVPTRFLIWVGAGVLLCSFADYLIDPSRSFFLLFSPMGHPEARRAEGSHEILRRFAPQDEGSGNSPTPHLINSLFLKKSIVPQSAIISGFIVSGIIDYKQPWMVLVIFSLLAIISKHTIQFRGNHIFNPANFALFVASLFKIPLTWSIESNIHLIIIAGIYLAYSYRKITHVLGYLIAFGCLFGILMKGTPLLIVNWFFVFIMLIEPKTSGYGEAGKGFIFGAIAGISSLAILKLFPQYDFYVGSLFIANLFRPLMGRIKK